MKAGADHVDGVIKAWGLVETSDQATVSNRRMGEDLRDCPDRACGDILGVERRHPLGGGLGGEDAFRFRAEVGFSLPWACGSTSPIRWLDTTQPMVASVASSMDTSIKAPRGGHRWPWPR
ncbi:MAG: hypothetical protein ACI8TF_000733 [Paracoccaceae bacterium]|jgi:hypothetical protein